MATGRRQRNESLDREVTGGSSGRFTLVSLAQAREHTSGVWARGVAAFHVSDAEDKRVRGSLLLFVSGVVVRTERDALECRFLKTPRALHDDGSGAVGRR
jgi:hypothetical protein